MLIKSKLMTSDAAIDAADRAGELPGLITNRIDSLSGDERRLLGESYPHADLDSVLIIEHGRQPAGILKTAGLFGGGLALALGGLGAMALKFRGS